MRLFRRATALSVVSAAVSVGAASVVAASVVSGASACTAVMVRLRWKLELALTSKVSSRSSKPSFVTFRVIEPGAMALPPSLRKA